MKILVIGGGMGGTIRAARSMSMTSSSFPQVPGPRQRPSPASGRTLSTAIRRMTR